MAIAASSNQTALRFIKESTFGVTPSTPALQELRYTGESINFNITNTTSNEIRSDRMTSDLVQTSADTSGDIQIELSADSYDSFIMAALGAAAWSSPITLTPTTIAAAATTNRYTIGSGTTAGIVVGQWIKLGGFANAANNGYKQVKEVVSTTVIEVFQDLVTESAVTGATILVSKYVRNGVTYHSYTIQKDLIDASTRTYFQFKGMRVGSLSLSFSTGSILTGSFSFMGLTATVSDAQIAGATVVAPTATEVMNSVGDISNIWFDGDPSTASFASLSLDINGSLRAQDAIGTLGHVGIALGRFAITGSTQIYFENKALYDKYLNATEFSYSFAVEDNAGNAFIFTLPRVKFSSASVVSGGLDQDTIMDASFEAIKSAGASGYMIAVDRF
jgi:hypothetical protein